MTSTSIRMWPGGIEACEEGGRHDAPTPDSTGADDFRAGAQRGGEDRAQTPRQDGKVDHPPPLQPSRWLACWGAKGRTSMAVDASNFPDQPGPDEQDANQLKDVRPPGRDPDKLPDGGGDDEDLGEDEAPLE